MKQKAKNLFNGRIVMVHPNLTSDPAHRQGEIGKIVNLFPDRDTAVVAFNNGLHAMYRLNALVTLRPKDALIANYAMRLDPGSNERKFVDWAAELALTYQAEALKLAMLREDTQEICTMNYSDYVELQMKNQQQKRLGRGQGI